MAKKKKEAKSMPKHDRSLSPLDFLEDECIGIMSESDDNSRESIIMNEHIKKEHIKKEPLQINIQNVPVEPMYTLKKYLQNLKSRSSRKNAANVVKIEIEDEVDTKDPLLLNDVDFSKKLHKDTGDTEDTVLQIKQEITSSDESDEYTPVSNKEKELFDKMISKRFNLKESNVMIPRDVPITPYTNTATFFMKLPREKHFETEAEAIEVEDEINKASFKSFIEGIEDFTNEVNPIESDFKDARKSIELIKIHDPLFNTNASAPHRQRATEIKRKKRRKEMFVFTNEKTEKSKQVPSVISGDQPICVENSEKSSNKEEHKQTPLSTEFVEFDRQTQSAKVGTKDFDDMTEEEIVGRCVDEIDFSSLVEDVQDVIRHLEETELKGSDKTGAGQPNIKKPCESNQNLETQQKTTKDTHTNNKNTLDQLHTQNITIKEKIGKDSVKKTQYQRSSCMFQNDQKADKEEQEQYTPKITDKQNIEKESANNTHCQRSSCMFQNDQNSDTEEANSLVTDSEENIESNSSDLIIKQVKTAPTLEISNPCIPEYSVLNENTVRTENKDPFSNDSDKIGAIKLTKSGVHTLANDLKDDKETYENRDVSGIEDLEAPIIKLTIVSEGDTEEKSTDENICMNFNAEKYQIHETNTEKYDCDAKETIEKTNDIIKSNESQINKHSSEAIENTDETEPQIQSEECQIKEKEPVKEPKNQDKLDDDHYSDIDVLLLSESEDENMEMDNDLGTSPHVPIPIKIEPEIMKPNTPVIPIYENITDSECDETPSQTDINREENDMPSDESHVVKEIFDNDEHNETHDEFDEIVNFIQGPGSSVNRVEHKASVKQSPGSLPSTSNLEEILAENAISKPLPVYENSIRINDSIFDSEYAVPSTSKTRVTSVKNDLCKVSGFPVPDRGKSATLPSGESSENILESKRSTKTPKDGKKSHERPKSRISNSNKAKFLDETPLSSSTESSRAPTPIPIPEKKESKRDYEKDYRKQKEKVKEQEKILTSRQMKIATLKKSYTKLEKKVGDKKIEATKMESEAKEYKKDIEKVTKKYNEFVSKNEGREKIMDNIQNDLAIKQQRIVKLEHMLKKKTVPITNTQQQDNEAMKKLQSELLEKQKQIDEMEAFLQGKDASVNAKTDKINQLETEHQEKDKKIFTLECIFKEKEKNFLIEKSQNHELQRKNDQLEKYVLQKTHIRPAKSSTDLEVQIKMLEAQVKDLQNEKVSWIKQNTKLSEIEQLCKNLQTKNKELQTSLGEKEKIASKVQQTSADNQRISNLELQNSDLMSQVKYVSVLQRRIRDLEDKLKIEFSNPEGDEASDADKLAALPQPTRSLPLNFLTRETPLFDAYSRTPYNRGFQTPRLLLGQQSCAKTTEGHIDGPSGSFATGDVISKLMEMRPMVPPPPVDIDITKPPPPINIDLVRPDSGDDASQISLPTSSIMSNPPASTESAPNETTEGNTVTMNPLGLQKFSSLCSGSFNVSQTHWSDDSNDEDEHDNDITDGLLNIGGKRSNEIQDESKTATPILEDSKLITLPLEQKIIIDSAVPNPLYNPFDQREDDTRPEVDESMCINQPGVEYHESHNASDDKHDLNLSIENEKKGILSNELLGDNNTFDSQHMPPGEDEEVKREIIAEILDIQIKRKELRDKINTSADSLPDIHEPVENESEDGEPSKKDKTKKKKKHSHDKKKKHKKHKKEGKHKKKKREKEKEKTEEEKLMSTLLKDGIDLDDDFLQLEPDISDLLDLALSDDEFSPRKSRKDRMSSSSDGEISSSPSPLRESVRSPTPILDDLTALEERLKSLNNEANKRLLLSDEQRETRVIKKLNVEDVFNVLSDVSDGEVESPDKLTSGSSQKTSSPQKASSPEKEFISPGSKKSRGSKLNIKRTITIKLDKNKEKDKSEIAQSTKSQVEESVDTRTLIEKAKDIQIECKNDQGPSKQLEKPKFDDKETEQMLKDLHSCLPKKKDFKMSSLKVPRKSTPSPELNIDETFSRSIKRVKSLRKRNKSKEGESRHSDDKDIKRPDKRRTRGNGKDGKRSITKDNDNSHHNQDLSPRNDGSLARKLYDRIQRGSDSQQEFSQMDPPAKVKDDRDRSKSQSHDSKSSKRSSVDRNSKSKRSSKESSKESRLRAIASEQPRSSEPRSSYIKKEKDSFKSEPKERKHTRSKSNDRKHSRSRSTDRKHSRSKSPERRKRRPRRSPSRFTRRKRSRSRSKDQNRQAAKRIKNKYINEKIRNQRKNHENNMDTEENCKKRGVQLYWDHDAQQNRVRLDGYGANGPAEILVNMMAVDISIKVHFKTMCMTCGHDVLGAKKYKHFENGVCSKKAKILQAGGVVFCSYCEITGAHWVEACPLLVSFCYSCWVWGHNYLHHHVADKGYLERLMRKFNEMRNWHHVNSVKTRESKIIPMNELIPLTQDDVAIRYEGKQKDIDDIGEGMPCSTTRPACWLVKANWTNIYKILEKPGFEWVTNADGFCLKKLPDNTEQFLSQFHNLLPGNHNLGQEEYLDYEYDESQEQGGEEVEGDEEGYSEEDEILGWLDY